MEIDFKDILNRIQEEQIKSFITLDKFHKVKEHYEVLPPRRRGLYWLWTNLSFQILLEIKKKPGTQEVPIGKLIAQRSKLNNIATIEKDNFRIVYNGIGGYNKIPATFGLRERINQEIHCNDYRTGTLNIVNRGMEAKNWAVSFFDLDNPKNAEIVNDLKTYDPYQYAKDLEMLWRLEYGTPILCRH